MIGLLNQPAVLDAVLFAFLPDLVMLHRHLRNGSSVDVVVGFGIVPLAMSNPGR
jgi:hypothetical protein